MSSNTTVVSSTFANLKASLANLRKEGERAKQAAEYFASVDTIVAMLRGGIRIKESWNDAEYTFKTKVKQPDGTEKWTIATAICTEYKLRAFRWANILDVSGEQPVITGSCLVAVTVKSYLNKDGELIGVSQKNSRFANAVFQGKEIVRMHGHLNDWERTNTKTGEVEKIKVFNVGGLGLYNKPSQFARRQEEVLAQLPDMTDMPEDESTIEQ